jgi:MFS family permease
MPADTTETGDQPAEPETGRFLAFQHKSFRAYWAARFFSTFAIQIISTSVAWQVYDISGSALALGLVGLVQFLPSLGLVLFTGAAADRFGRRTIMALCLLAQAFCALALLGFTVEGFKTVTPIFAILAVIGIARAFFGPAQQSLVVNLVPPQHLANAIAWNSSSWQVAAIVGPVAGGLLYGVTPEAAYGAGLSLFLIATLLIVRMPKPVQHRTGERASWTTLVAGIRYIMKERIVLGAISLDLFAVLLGGAVALMPVYARDILELGPWGLGLLRAAPGVGAVAMAIFLVIRPIRDHAGLKLFFFVAGFGIFTVVFGFATTGWLAIGALIAIGACDMISVYIRETLLQLWTPDAVRGRVNAVNMVFIGASNELGEFRAGVMASMIGAVGAVVAGGAGTVAVAGLWAKWFPELRKARHLDGRT